MRRFCKDGGPEQKIRACIARSEIHRSRMTEENIAKHLADARAGLYFADIEDLLTAWEQWDSRLDSKGKYAP